MQQIAMFSVFSKLRQISYTTAHGLTVYRLIHFFAKNKKWSDEGAVPLELGANLAVYLASAESNGITGKLISAQWDPWEKLQEFKSDLGSDIYTLRRIVPKDRGKTWGDK